MPVATAFLAILSATPAPDLPPDEVVTPGPWGFAAIAFIAVAVVLLIADMMRRIRRARYRSEVREELDAEEAARDAGRPRDEDPPA